MLQLLETQYYPDNSRIRVVLAMSNPDIDHWNGIKDIGLMLKETECSQKVVSTKKEFVKYIAKSTIVAKFHIWSFCVEKLQRMKRLTSV